MRCLSLLLILLGLVTRALAATTQPATHAAGGYPRIAMLWSKADIPGDQLANWARHSLILVSPDDLGLDWKKDKFPAMAEEVDPQTIADARQTLARLHKLNPHAVVLFEMYYFEANDKDYPADSPWWERDSKGKRTQFWPGCYNMDVANPDYIRHIARRIAAVHKALDGSAGLYLDNLRFEPAAKKGWKELLTLVRKEGGDMPIMANAGWDSDDLEWVAPLINGIMYEDSVAHTADKDTEKFYARIEGFEKLLREPRISLNERFGPRKDEARMMRDLLRTLVYTDMRYLYSDSTNGHNHAWWPEWNASLGMPTQTPAKPTPGKLAQRDFEGGRIYWLPAAAKESAIVKLDEPLCPVGQKEAVNEVTIKPGTGVMLVRKP